MAKAPATEQTTQPPAETEKSGAAKTRRFTAAFDLIHDGKSIAPGGKVSLTEEQHAEAYEVGAVTAPWSKAEAGD
jgi:hypothetical protein